MDFSKLDEQQLKIADMVVEAAKKHGVDPNLLLAQAYRESAFRHIPSADKDSDAFGVMQIRPSTAEQMKLGDPRDLNANIEGGARLMKTYLDKYKTPEAALLAYHQGPGVADQYIKSGGDLKSVGPKGLDYVIDIGKYGGFGAAPAEQKAEGEAPAEAAPNPFGEPGELPPDINKMPPSTRPNLQDMPEAYQKASRLVRNEKGDISGATLGTAGALTGLATQALGGKGLKEAEAAVTNAKAAYESARAAANAASGASVETAQRLAQEAARLEQEYRASQTAFQALERELAEAAAKSTQYLPPAVPDRAKVPGASGAENYARKMPGQLPPEAMLAQVEDMTTGKNPRGMGAGDIAARNAENIARQKQLGMGTWQMTGTGPEQLVLSPEETARRQSSMEAGSQRAKALTPQVDTARAEMEARRSALSEAEKVRQRETAAAQRAAREAQTSATAAQAGLKTAKEAAPSGLGKVGAVAQKVPLTGALAGAGMGLSAAEALNRYEKGDTSGAVLSGVQAVLDGMAMLPPGTPVTAFLKGLGIVGGLATTAYDLYRTRQMEEEAKAKQAQQPPQKARGGLTLMR